MEKQTKNEVWLVYEIIDAGYADKETVPYCSVSDMAVFPSKKEALKEMARRREMYIEDDNDWFLLEETEDCLKFNDALLEGWFDVRLKQIA